MKNLGAVIVLLTFVGACGVGLGLLGVWLGSRKGGDDPHLDIKPPRRLVDADGRSDYRPELQQAASRRQREIR